MSKNIVKTCLFILCSIIIVMPSHARLRILESPEAKWVSKSKCAIVWKTSNYSTSKVRWGKSKSYNNFSTGDSGVTHQVRLTGLEGGTIYHFMAISTGKEGRTVASSDYIFETPSPNLVLRSAIMPASAILGASYRARVTVLLEDQPLDRPYTIEIYRKAYYRKSSVLSSNEVKLGEAMVSKQHLGTYRTVEVPFVVKPMPGLDEGFEKKNEFVIKAVSGEKESHTADNSKSYPFTLTP